jgi:hypothetical protein
MTNRRLRGVSSFWSENSERPSDEEEKGSATEKGALTGVSLVPRFTPGYKLGCLRHLGGAAAD